MPPQIAAPQVDHAKGCVHITKNGPGLVPPRPLRRFLVMQITHGSHHGPGDRTSRTTLGSGAKSSALPILSHGGPHKSLIPVVHAGSAACTSGCVFEGSMPSFTQPSLGVLCSSWSESRFAHPGSPRPRPRAFSTRPAQTRSMTIQHRTTLTDCCGSFGPRSPTYYKASALRSTGVDVKPARKSTRGCVFGRAKDPRP